MAELDEPDAKVEVYIAWRKREQSTAVYAFVDTVRNFLNNRNRSRTLAWEPAVS